MTPAFPTLAGCANTHNEANLLFDGRRIPERRQHPSRARTIGEADEPLPWSVVTLQILAGGHHLLHAAALIARFAHERSHIDDPLVLLAGDLRPVAGVSRIGQILVLLDLLADGREQVVGTHALFAAADQALEGQLLGPPHDRLDHGARGEVLEVEDLLVAVGVRHLEEAVLLGEAVHRVDRGRDHRLDGAHGVTAEVAGFRLRDRDLGRQVLPEDVARRAAIRPLDLDLHVEATRPQDGRIDEVLPVTGPDDDDVAQPFHAVDLGEELGHDGRLHVRGDAGAAGAEERVHLVEDHHDRHVVGRLLLGLDEDLADLALGLAHVLVQELRPLDVEEEALDLLATLLRDLLGEVVGHRLGDHRLTAAGRAVEEHTLRRRELVLLIIVGVEVGELDGVLDGLDLSAEAADVVVADVGHFLEREILDLALRQLLQQVARLRIHQKVVADLEPQLAERIGDDADLLLVGAQGDDRTLLVELLLEDHDVTLDLVAGGLDDVQSLVEDQLLTGLERLRFDRGVEVDLHLPPLRQDVDRRVLVDREVHAVRRGRRTELVDLFLERGDLLARLVESVHQLLVLVERLQERAVDLAELALSEARLLRYFANVDVDNGPSRGHAAPPPVILIAVERRWPPEAKGAFTPVDATMKPRSPRLMCPIWGPRGPVNNRGNHCMRAGESPKSSGENSAESERTRVG